MFYCVHWFMIINLLSQATQANLSSKKIEAVTDSQEVVLYVQSVKKLQTKVFL